MHKIWQDITSRIKHEISHEDYSTWILPLKVDDIVADKTIKLIAPNKYVMDYVEQKFGAVISNAIKNINSHKIKHYVIAISRQIAQFEKAQKQQDFAGNLSPYFNFDNFIEGKSNQLGLAAARQVAKTPGVSYNPLFIYGATGLGKTHLMHAIGWRLKQNGSKRVLYIRSERFVRDMVTAIQNGTINKFKEFYHSLNALLIDDIQFIAGKDRSQEEFFHSFNFLLEDNHQVVLTCDKYPKEINDLEDRLISRFGSGLTVLLEPPEYETRVAILISKAKQTGFDLPYDTACFIAKLIKSNIRELEGALNNIFALAQLKNTDVNIDLAKQALRDLISVQNRIISINNIQKIVADFYKISVSDLVSKSRSRSVTRPRQICMALAKELTDKSLPEIGRSFGGRDHSTVIHAKRKIDELKQTDVKIEEDYRKLRRILSA